jgi:hypothetical protein
MPEVVDVRCSTADGTTLNESYTGEVLEVQVGHGWVTAHLRDGRDEGGRPVKWVGYTPGLRVIRRPGEG